MPYLVFREIWTPLKLFRIRLFQELGTQDIYIKIGARPRRCLIHKSKAI